MKGIALVGFVLAGGVVAAERSAPASADLLIVNAHVYSLAWDEPDREGRPAPNAPHTPGGWHPDAQALAIRGTRIEMVGSTAQALTLKGPATRVIDAAGATIVPGLI